MLQLIDLFSGAQPKQYYSMPFTAQQEPNIGHESNYAKIYVIDLCNTEKNYVQNDNISMNYS